MTTLDYTKQGRKPTTAQIISDWKKQGRPGRFTVEYGETFAEFEETRGGIVRWMDSGNGCSGVKRDEVVKALSAATDPVKARGRLG